MKREATSYSGRDSGTRVDRLLFVWKLGCCWNIKVELSCTKSTSLLSLLCHTEKSMGMLYGKWSEFTSINQMQCYFVRVFVFIHGHSGASRSFAIVREGNDESLIKSRPQRSELPDLRQSPKWEFNSFFFYSLWIFVPLSPGITIHTKLVLRGYCDSMCAAYQQGE